MLSTPIGRLRLISVLEAVTFLVLLFIAVPVKYASDPHKPILVQIMGPVHGTFFILYVIQTLDVRSKLKWDGGKTMKVLIAAVIPFAPFVVERRLRDEAAAPAARAKA